MPVTGPQVAAGPETETPGAGMIVTNSRSATFETPVTHFFVNGQQNMVHVRLQLANHLTVAVCLQRIVVVNIVLTGPGFVLPPPPATPPPLATQGPGESDILVNVHEYFP